MEAKADEFVARLAARALAAAIATAAGHGPNGGHGQHAGVHPADVLIQGDIQAGSPSLERGRRDAGHGVAP